jgi:hypothetical protein
MQYFTQVHGVFSEVGAQPREPMNGHNAQTWIILPKSPKIHAYFPNILPKTSKMNYRV